MALFTIVLDHRGGTYVHQVIGDDPRSAVASWTETALPEVVPLAEAGMVALRGRLSSDSPCPLDGMRNVWCSSFMLNGHLAIVHVVMTVPG